MKHFTYVIIDDDQQNGLKTKAIAEGFQSLIFLATAHNYDDGLDCILEHKPDIVFLEIDPSDKDSNLSLHLINELHRYLTVIPKVFITTKNDALCFNAFKYGVFDYFLFPLEAKELRKSVFRLEKEYTSTTPISKQQFVATASNTVSDLKPITSTNTLEDENQVVAIEVLDEISPSTIENEEETNLDSEIIDETEEEIIETVDNEIIKVDDEEIENNLVENKLETNENKEVTFLQVENTKEKPLIICVKSYGDYRYIEAKDICYLQADNNSTDIHLHTGEMITAFKTLKHFEGVLKYPFARIHNSYIVNIDFVSRIHTGNAVCHIKNTTTKLPFSKSYKENIDAIITTIASGNYLEI
ncbi:LytR/AlgR family response regulator transcription factor [Flavobacterium sp.]|uniref:LytR/AlgR family response regulator transcription factor n=1 Tax=Flavobacterium sp. TaxID=239 RepID=UPI003751F669